MRKLIYLFIVAGMLLSCQGNNEYRINGSVTDEAYEGTNVYLQAITDDAIVAVDTAVVLNGTFSFSGVADTKVLRLIALDTPQQQRIPVLVEPGRIEVVFDELITVKGTKENEAYTNFRERQIALRQEMREIMETFNRENADETMTDSREVELRASFEALGEQENDLHFNFFRENIGNPLGEYAFPLSASQFEPAQQRELLAHASEEFKATESVRRIIQRLENLEKVAIGKEFVDFTLQDTEGNEVSLSDYAGKGDYVLIDFWAAWCPPCRQEMPHVVAAYEKYKAKGFEVVGVSFDRTHDEWIEGIKELDMNWPQMSDLQFWDTPVVELYGIQGIPHTVLLDREGIIIDKNLRGDALDTRLAELMP